MSETWECGECQVENDLDDEPEEGMVVECAECGAEFEIVGVDPLEMEALEVPESDDDDDAPDSEAETEADEDEDEDEDEEEQEEDWD